MLRTALQPKWMALLVFALVCATLFVWAGNWQWDRARESEPSKQTIAERPVRELSDVLEPQQRLTGEALRTPVRATGQWVPDTAVVIADRTLAGEDGQWVVAALRVSGLAQEAGGARLPVVLGWQADGAEEAVSLPAGPVQLTGVLVQSEGPRGPAEASASGLPAFVSLSSAELVNAWGPPIYSAYLIGADVDVPDVAPVSAPAAEPQRLVLRNVSYALQWFVFAAFAVFIWWRMVRDAHEDAQAGTAERQGVVDETSPA